MVKLFFVILVAGFIIFSGCVEQPDSGGTRQDVQRAGNGLHVSELADGEILPLLLENEDFGDWRSDFVKAHGSEPSLEVTKKERLSEERVSEMIEGSQAGTKAVVERILSGLPVETGNVFYVEMKDSVQTQSGIIVIIDTKEKQVLKFFATLGITAG